MDRPVASTSGDHPGNDPTPNSAHTVKELEVQLNELFFNHCKVDACFDRFVAQLGRLHPLWNGRYKGRFKLRPDALPEGFEPYTGEHATDAVKQGFDDAFRQLHVDLARLAPKCFEPKPSAKTLDLETILPKCQQRATHWIEEHATTGFCRESDLSSDSFRASLLRTLAEVNYQELESHLRPREEHGAPPLRESAFWQACRQLKQIIASEQSTASFACGGTIAITTTTAGEDLERAVAERTSNPVSIYWGTGNDANARRVVLPIGSVSDSNAHVLQELISDCTPATFGKGEQDVLDLAYRRAGKMDPDMFATTFDLSQFNILENVEQILLPSVGNDEESELQLRKLSARLYKLNVYSGPSGLFRTHIDTPRSTSQIGSLVVCLPSRFEGGNLIVRHQGQAIDFDWGSKSDSTIQWAAFYSDCEHEIKTVSSGDRITLTYNLFITEPVGGSLLPNAIVDSKTLPLYGYIKQLIEQPGFMKHGGVLGFFCSHAYAHASKKEVAGLPRRLKGSDLVLYSVFEALGIETGVLPVLGQNGQYIDKNPRLESDDDDGHEAPSSARRYHDEAEEDEEYLAGSIDKRYNSVPITTVLDAYLGGDISFPGIVIKEYRNRGFDYTDDVDSRWKVLVLKQRICGLANFVYRAKGEGLDVSGLSYRASGARVGSSLYEYKTHNNYNQEENDDKIARDLWPFLRLPGITWLAEPKHNEMAFSHLAHGNQTSLATRYSCAAILAVIPSYAERSGAGSDAPMCV